MAHQYCPRPSVEQTALDWGIVWSVINRPSITPLYQQVLNIDLITKENHAHYQYPLRLELITSRNPSRGLTRP